MAYHLNDCVLTDDGLLISKMAAGKMPRLGMSQVAI